MNIILTLLSLLITVAYLAYTRKLFGRPWSISDTRNLLEEKKKGLGHLFTVWTYSAGLPLMIAWLDISKGQSFQFLVFFACGSLMLLGTAAEFKKSMTREVHYISAAICVLSAITWLALTGFWLIPLISFAICLPLAYKDGKWIYWIEIAALIATYITLFLIEVKALITPI